MPGDDFDVLILGAGWEATRPPSAPRSWFEGRSRGGGQARRYLPPCRLHPTKALLESSELYHRIAVRGAEFGVDADRVRFDYARIAARRDAVVSQLHKGVQFLMKKNKIEVVAGSVGFATGTPWKSGPSNSRPST